jgi:hypothetical protein
MLDFNVAVTANTGVVISGGTTLVNSDNALFDGDMGVLGGLVSSDTFDISGINTNSVIKGGLGADTFIVNNAFLDFAQLSGGSDASLDVLQLTASYSVLNLNLYNYFGQQAVNGFEVIDMATDVGANTVTLTVADLFNMGSQQFDAMYPTDQMLTINGGANDVVNCGVGLPGGFTQTLGTFDAIGAVNAGGDYSKYAGSYTDAGGHGYTVELLLQQGIAVV